MLRLDITWLSGTARLARAPSDPEADWPPQPDRIYSALVASWGLGGEDVHERAALEWLEGLSPPCLADVAITGQRQTVTVYVPPNDARGETVLPERRRRQPRTFPSVTLDADAPVHLALSWDAVPSPEHRRALDKLAQRTSYVGHSASFVLMRFTETEAPPDNWQPVRRAPYQGRLSELEGLYHRHLRGEIDARPRPSSHSGRAKPVKEYTRPFPADPNSWIVFEHAVGERPDLRSTAIVADHMRLALMEGWTRTNGRPAPGWIAGHEKDGSPARDAHLAVVPLANVGWQHSNGQLMGLALVPPREQVEEWNQPGPDPYERHDEFRRAVASLGEKDIDGRMKFTLAPQQGRGNWSWKLAPASGGTHSLDPYRYLRNSRRWASVTPVVLDRHPKAKGNARADEIEEILRASCARAGLPGPNKIHIGKHASHRGVPPARPQSGAPPWAGWSRKQSFGARPVYHVRLAFDEPVAGPIFLGAGRFVGLGLFLPQPEVNT